MYTTILLLSSIIKRIRLSSPVPFRPRPGPYHDRCREAPGRARWPAHSTERPMADETTAAAPAAAAGGTDLRSVHTSSLPDILGRHGIALLVSTYQAGKLIAVRAEGERANTHFRNFAVPMGLALGETDTHAGWRAGKARGGVLLDVPSGRPVARGLSMPHSPRWYHDRLWVLESGAGSIAVVDEATGRLDAVALLPGFTRGLDFF